MIKLNNHQELPKNFRNVLEDIHRCREKSARQKYLLDLSEGLLVHICAFVLGEYKYSGISSIELEKLLLKNNRNLSFGTYLLFLRTALDVLNKGGYKSKLNKIAWESNEWPIVKRFEVLFDAVKVKIDSLEGSVLELEAGKVPATPQGKTNVIKFFDKVVNLRNRVAHPHQIVKDKEVSWPHNEDYFNAINPPLEAALMFLIEQLDDAWSYRFYRVADTQSDVVQLEQEDTSNFEEVSFSKNLEKGIRVLVNSDFDVIISDWKVLLQASEEALAFIEQENENLRKMASVDELKEHIVLALDDEQISIEEFRFFESISRVKLGLSAGEMKALIYDVAKTMNIENPFPEVDRRFIEAIDTAIKSKSFNEFVLKLMGEQYGVDSEMFDKIVEERALELNVDPNVARQSTNFNFTPEQLDAFTRIISAKNWIRSIHTLNKGVGDSNYKITGESSTIGTKEFYHKQAFADVLFYVKSKLTELNADGGLTWDAHVNQWQIGAMTSYIWVCFYPENVPTKSFIALHVSIYQDGSIAIGLLPDWKDYGKIKNYNLLKQVTRSVLDSFVKTYEKEIAKYDNFYLWNYNNMAFDSLSNAITNYNWVIREDYNFEQIQFVLTPEEMEKNPQSISNAFDISFNLFNGVIPEIINDYTLISSQSADLFETHFEECTALIQKLKSIVSSYRDEQSVNSNEGNVTTELINGFVGMTIESTEEKQKVKFNLQVYFDYLKRKFNFEMKFSASAEFNPWHDSISKALSKFAIDLENVEVFYRKGILLVRLNSETFQEIAGLSESFVNSVLQNCVLNFAEENVNPLGFQFNKDHFIQNKKQADHFLDTSAQLIEPILSNKRRQERKIFHQLNYADAVGMVESHKVQTLQWGVNFATENILPFISLKLESDSSNIQLTHDLRAYAEKNPNWRILTNNNLIQENSGGCSVWDDTSTVISASSSWNKKHGPEQAKLNLQEGLANWSAKSNDLKQWIQVDFGMKKKVEKIAIQGRYNREQWVKKFKIFLSVDGKKFEQIGGEFDGSSDQHTTIEVELNPNPIAQIVRIVPTEWHGHISLRFDVQASEFKEHPFEMKTNSFINNLNSTEALSQELFNIVSDLQKNFPGKFGMIKA